MRLFLAGEIADAVKLAAADAALALRNRLEMSGGLDARWIPAGNLHITLWFLGEVPEHQATPLIAALEQAFRVAPFEIHVRGFGAFPGASRPRVLWLGLHDATGGLRAVHGLLTDRLAPLGFEPERRPFSPHLTVARVRELRRGRLNGSVIHKALEETASDAGTTTVSSVTLFQSRLSPKGARYEPLLRVPLQE